jgi:hypothetical protein
VISPTKLASVINVFCDGMTKSSADSISNFTGVEGRDAVAILPSGFPVLKKNGAALTAGAAQSAVIPTIPTSLLIEISCPVESASTAP